MNDDELESRIVWILGTPRSGSTWLLQMLARATNGAAVREPLIGAHLGMSIGGLLGMRVPNDAPLTDVMRDRLPYFFSRDSQETWRPALRTLLLNRIRYEVDGYKASGLDVGPVIIKEPWGAGGASILLETLPRSRVLFLQRDGRDVVDSLLDGADGGWISTAYGVMVPDREQALRETARLWVQSMDAVQRAYNHHDFALRHSMRYEHLVADTEATLELTTKWLLCNTDRVAEVAAACQYDQAPDGAKGPGKFLRSGTPGAWVEHFTDHERAVLEAIMAPTLLSYGYAL